MEMRTLNIGRQIEVPLGIPAPMINGQPMTIGDLIVKAIPMLRSTEESYMRIWNIALEIDKADESIELPQIDCDMLKKALTMREQAIWERVNLEKVFDGE